jgi:hypothetical protein
MHCEHYISTQKSLKIHRGQTGAKHVNVVGRFLQVAACVKKKPVYGGVGSSVGIVTDYGLDGLGSNPGGGGGGGVFPPTQQPRGPPPPP